MSEEQTEDIKTIRVLTFSSEQQDWDEWSQKFLSMAAERGYRDIMEDTARPPRESLIIDKKNPNGMYTFSESERSELKRIRKEEDQYQPSALATICMDEEKDNDQTEEVIQSEEKEDEQNNVQDDAQVPMTFEEMLLRCEEQVDSSCDSKKIKLVTWDITVKPVTQDIKPKMDHDKEFQRISRDRKEHEEQRRRCHRTDMSTYQVDTQFQNHMVRHAYKEVKTQDHQDNNKEKVSIKQEMDKQPNRGKRKCDDDKDDQKPRAKPKKDVPADDEDSQDDEEQDIQDNNEQEMIKKACIKETFAKHFKRTLGPQDNDEEPHPAIAHMYAIHISETMNVLQAMVNHQ